MANSAARATIINVGSILPLEPTSLIVQPNPALLGVLLVVGVVVPPVVDVGVGAGTSTPVPVMATDMGVGVADVVTVNVPELVPAEVGENINSIVHCAPGMVVAGQLPADPILKGKLALAVIPLMGTVPVFDIAVIILLELPTVTRPKSIFMA